MTRVYHRRLPNATTKICSRCNIEKPLEAFSKDRQHLSSRCKVCKSAPRTQRAFSFTKTCYKCKEEKSIDEFSLSKEKRDGHCTLCKACKKDRFQATKEQTRGKRKASNAHWHQTHYEERREKENARCREWYKNNPECATENRNKRRARQLNAATGGRIDYHFILERDNFICHICNKDIEGGKFDFDHVIPLVRGGSHAQGNIKMSHSACNRRKGKKLMEELTAYQKRGV